MIENLERVQRGEPVSLVPNDGIIVMGNQVFNGVKEITVEVLRAFNDICVIMAENEDPELLQRIRKETGALVINEKTYRQK